MAERYSKLFALPENLYAAGAPVIVEAGSLLKDTQTGKVLAQLKLKSVSPKTVKAVKVRISPLDTVNKPLDGETVHEYLDLNIERDGEFGQKNAVPLSNASTRAFGVEVTEVDFADNCVWTSTGETWEPLPAPEPVGDQELTKQYKLRFGDKAQYKPTQDRGAWVCACGGINSDTEDACHICGNRLSELLACDMKALAAEKEQRLAKEAAEREANAAADKAAAAAAAKKTKRILAIAIPAVAVCIAALLITKVVIPNSNYNKAKALLDAGQYEEAIVAFEALNGYKDSAEQLIVAKNAKAEEERLAEKARIEAENAAAYEKAEALFAAGDYDGAIAAFKLLGDYRDSSIKAQYTYALSCIETSHYVDAMTALKEIEDYEDSESLIQAILSKYYRQRWSEPNVGDLISFGNYRDEEIEWIVLGKEDNKLFLISRYALDCKQYNEQGGATWETCDLRNWLNENFYFSAFSKEEQSLIIDAIYSEEEKKNTPGYNSDKVSLLSISEATLYFNSETDRICQPTQFAETMAKVQMMTDNRLSWTDKIYWLRSPGANVDHAATVYLRDGSISEYGSTVYFYYLVRPVIWIDLN